MNAEHLAIAQSIAESNSLADLAARIRVEHEATSTALRRSIEHAIAAGELLIEAKAQVSHGQWLPWLAERCSLSERTAQLYMRLAKNKTAIEDKIRNGVADLTINEAAALLVLTSNLKKLMDFAKRAETLADNPEELIKFCVEEGVAVIHTPNYDPFAGRSEAEVCDFLLCMLFLVRRCGWSLESAGSHLEWLLRGPQNIGEWLGKEGDNLRAKWGMRNPSKKFLKNWAAFQAKHAGKTRKDIEAELARAGSAQ